jgi:hypothetical protein
MTPRITTSVVSRDYRTPSSLASVRWGGDMDKDDFVSCNPTHTRNPRLSFSRSFGGIEPLLTLGSTHHSPSEERDPLLHLLSSPLAGENRSTSPFLLITHSSLRFTHNSFDARRNAE